MSYWAETARRVITEVHLSLPEEADLATRRKAIDAAYPFGQRRYYPYKTWLKARREYLVKFGHVPKNAPPESPMERMMRRSKAAGERLL